MDLNLTNRTAIVTGGATGLGREFVLSLAKEGVNICFTYMREEEHPGTADRNGEGQRERRDHRGQNRSL